MAKVTYKRDKLKDINGNYIVSPTLADMVYHSDGKTSEDKIAILNGEIEQTNTKLSEAMTFLTPEMFGAIGDGVANDTSAFLKTLEYSENNGIKEIQLTKKYLLSPDVLKLHSNLLLNGKGVGEIITKEISQYNCVLANDGFVENVVIDGIRFNHYGDTMTSYVNDNGGMRSIFVNSCDKLTIKNCECLFKGRHAISIAGYGVNVLIENVRVLFRRIGTSDYDSSGLYIDTFNHTIKDCYVSTDAEDSTNTFLRGGIESHGDKWIVINNRVENCINAFHVVNKTKSTNDGEKIFSNNTSSGCQYGVNLWSLIGGKEIKNLNITNNVFNMYENKEFIPFYAIGYINSSDDQLGGDLVNVKIDGNIINYETPSETDFVVGWGVEFKGAINLSGLGNANNISITNNIVNNSPHGGVCIGALNVKRHTDILIKNNMFKDCGYIFPSQPLNQKFSGVFYIANADYVNIIDNTIIFEEERCKKILYLMYCETGKFTNVIFLRNNVINKRKDYKNQRIFMRNWSAGFECDLPIFRFQEIQPPKTTYTTSTTLPDGVYYKFDQVIYRGATTGQRGFNIKQSGMTKVINEICSNEGLGGVSLSANKASLFDIGDVVKIGGTENINYLQPIDWVCDWDNSRTIVMFQYIDKNAFSGSVSLKNHLPVYDTLV